MRDGYVGLLTRLLRRRSVVPIVAAIVLALGATMFVFVGRDFFPAIDGGQIQLCVQGKTRARTAVDNPPTRCGAKLPTTSETLTRSVPAAVSQELTELSTGKATSHTPGCNGTAKVISPTTSGIATKKIMSVPWAEKIWFDFLRHAVGDVFLLRIAAGVGKGEDGDRLAPAKLLRDASLRRHVYRTRCARGQSPCDRTIRRARNRVCGFTPIAAC
jgi:hypothetical protein